jgi:hypothetical protein
MALIKKPDFRSLYVMFVALMFATALMAETPKDAPAQAAQTAATPAKIDNKDGVVCKNEAVIGSKMPKRTCYNKAQMAEKAADDRANLERMQNASQMPH